MDVNFVKLEGVPRSLLVPRELPDLGAEHFLNKKHLWIHEWIGPWIGVFTNAVREQRS